MSDISREFLDCLDRGELCLHPTDSIPGITWNPNLESGYQKLTNLKGGGRGAPFVCLSASVENAVKNWQPLPENWQKALSQLWPCPLTVIWKASEVAPKGVQSEDGSIALRVPALGHDCLWFQEILDKLDFPIPSTSVNHTREPPATTWQEASSRFGGQLLIPPAPPMSFSGQSSTLIRIQPDGSYDLVRSGLLSRHIIDRHLELAGNEGAHPWYGKLLSSRLIPRVDDETSIILGSSSPRRRQLFKEAGVGTRILKPSFEEAVRAGEGAREYVIRNSREKAMTIINDHTLQRGEIVVSADTVVALDNRILEKPRSVEHAHQMLADLSGMTHQVYTGYCIAKATPSGTEPSLINQVVTTDVTFQPLTNRDIDDYVQTREPMDKAGAYGLQGIGAFLIRSIEGSISNVIGLPMDEVLRDLKSLDSGR